MPFMPFQILGIWLRGLLSIAILAGGIYLLSRWFDESHVVEVAQIKPVARIEVRDPKNPAGEPVLMAPPTESGMILPGVRAFRPELGWKPADGLACGRISPTGLGDRGTLDRAWRIQTLDEIRISETRRDG